MTVYQGLAKKYRPQKFSEVFEQDSIVQTLKNALRLKRVGHAYLFCGTRGTGKTTLARLFSKAINCHEPSPDYEPCNQCPSCKEIISGNSLDVIEIDGASNRGIDDIRNLNETVGYSSSSGKCKIYIIDEVHMLTKEAFNALLKTLEEPPEHVIFFFATTEPHKVLPTIISRCQRFDLHRISHDKIQSKLGRILNDLGLKENAPALSLIAAHAEGSLRDAESLLDQLLCYQEGGITVESVSRALGLVSRELFFNLDNAAREHDLLFAFELAEQVFKQGSHLEYFLENLAEHYRNILLVKLGKNKDLSSHFTSQVREKYLQTEKNYTKEQCLEILDILSKELEKLAKSSFKRINLEILLLEIIRSMKKMPLDSLVGELIELKAAVESPPKGPDKVIKEDPITLEKAPKPNVQPLPQIKDEAPKVPDQLVKEIPITQENAPKPAAPHLPKEEIDDTIQKKINQESVMQFAAVALSGSLRKG